MKRIIFTAIAFISITISNAQTEAPKTAENPKEVALSEIKALSNAIDLDEKMKEVLQQVFLLRAEELSNAKTFEEKKKIFEMYGEKLLGGLNEQQRKKLESNRELYEKLTRYKG